MLLSKRQFEPLHLPSFDDKIKADLYDDEVMKTRAVSSTSLFSDPISGELKLRKSEEVCGLKQGDRVATSQGVFSLIEAYGHWKLKPVRLETTITTGPVVGVDLSPITEKNFHRRSATMSRAERIAKARELGMC
jgi:hypothetical protein